MGAKKSKSLCLGAHESQMSEGGEGELYTYLVGCQKNPGHKQFIPIDTFTLNHLPEGHRDKDLFELIKVKADLTVRVNVKITSPRRPEFWPNTKKAYPFYDRREENVLRTGSGMMYGVYGYTDGFDKYEAKHRDNYTTCWCKQCQHSDTASKVWWEFFVRTATHVVFDDIEASNTSVRLFYDREESSVVIVDQVGEHETQETENEEADLHTQYNNNCKKNPGHKEFIPIDILALDKLPVHCTEDLFKLIKSHAMLTVRIGTKLVSQHRPEFWPKTKNPYPFYNSLGSTKVRNATGTIQRVVQITNGYEDEYGHKHWTWSDVCMCDSCQHVARPSKVWWSVQVLTAAHVIYDDIEARETSCRLFYNRKDSPEIVLTKASVENVNINEDSCTLSFTTCDESLANKLTFILKRARRLLAKVQEDHKSSRDEFKLTFIVSHPHGCAKQVSVGQWTEKKTDEEFKYLHKFIYTTCTCSGSSGA